MDIIYFPFGSVVLMHVMDMLIASLYFLRSGAVSCGDVVREAGGAGGEVQPAGSGCQGVVKLCAQERPSISLTGLISLNTAACKRMYKTWSPHGERLALI